MGRCGLRVDEVPYPGDVELRWSDKADGWLVEVRGKNTAGGDPKVRDAWMPEAVETNVRRFSRERDRETGETWVQRSKATVRRWVKEAAREVAETAASQFRRSAGPISPSASVASAVATDRSALTAAHLRWCRRVGAAGCRRCHERG
jgi:hypothetical protein